MVLGKADIAFMLGFSAQGDFGWSSWYTRKNGSKVCFPKYVLDGKRKTPARVAQRDKWRAAAAEWRLLTQQRKKDWQAAARKLSLPATGYNIFLWYQISNNTAVIQTIERQTGISLLGP
ncbi:MAG TPA: hypothetical protein VNO50_12785 [Pyrinomonadaceae bacterium]|nr:hypothetical protein [Pyrinomonadaceae bacterium]